MSRTNVQKHHLQFKRFQDHLQGKEGQILLGAFQCIVEKGLPATTIRTIAGKVGVNPGIIHYYFESKEHLLSRVLEICYHNAITNMEALFATDQSNIEKIESLFELGLSLLGPRRDELIVLASFWAYSLSGDSYMLKLHRKLNVKLQATMSKILGETIGDFGSGISKNIAILMIGAMEGLVFQYVLGSPKIPPRELVGLLKELILPRLLANVSGRTNPVRIVNKEYGRTPQK